MEAPYETLLADRLAEITHDSIAQGVSPLVVVWAASNDDRGNGVPHIDKVSVELNAGHRRHMNVGDQARCFGETRGSEKIGCRCEILDGIAQRRHEPPHGRAMESIIVNNRDERRFRHTASGSSPEQISARPLTSSRYLGHRIPPSNIRARKLWFTRCPLAENRTNG
jgi:hypothetical protein